ncbi:thioredoxin family protein [[Clostridium] innocuum]|nr:thioredoxin family protein [[Clostridium] innocuum]
MKEYMTAIHSMEEFQEAAAKGGVSVFTFSANWGPDCRFIEPFMPKLVEAFSDYTFYYVDRDENIDICQALMVMGIPSFVAYKDGKESGRFVSKLRKTEKEINDFLAAQK